MVGTPTEESWCGVSRLPGLRAHVSRWGACPARPLAAAFPRLRDAGRDAQRLAASLLQPDPTRRLAASRALTHEYFAPLPPRLQHLPDGELWSNGLFVFVWTMVWFFVLKGNPSPAVGRYKWLNKFYTVFVFAYILFWLWRTVIYFSAEDYMYDFFDRKALISQLETRT